MTTSLPTDSAPLNRRQLALGVTGSLIASTAAAAARPALPSPWTGEGFVERPGGRLHYVSMGEGPPLVLLHKLGGWAVEWRAMAPLLAARYRVLAFDMPGHGDSTMRSPAPFIQTVGESAAMLHAALQDMGVERCTVVGASLGGCAGIALAANFPEMVSKLVPISVALFTAATRAEIAKQDEGVRAQYGPNWEPLPRTGAQVAEFASLDPGINDELNRSRARGGAWVRASERGVGVAGMDRLLARVTAPTLLVYADRGRYLVYEDVGRKALPGVQVAKIAGAGSFVYQEKPAETAAAVLSFLQA